MKKQYIGHVEIPLKRVHLELTNVCEFDCLFCPKSKMKRAPGFMEIDLAKRAISEMGQKGICEKVTLHVMGEPTLHRQFFEILAHAEKEAVKIGLTTNGRNLSKKVGKRLVDYNLHQIDVSLQTPDASSFALRRARLISFEEYLSGIFNFFFAYKKVHPDTIFKFRFLNTRFKKKQMEKTIGSLNVISSTADLRRTFRHWADRVYDGFDVDKSIRAHAMEKIGKLVSYKWHVVEVYPNVFFETYVLDDWGHAFGGGEIRDAWAGYCFGMRDHFAILYNGDVTLCCMDYDGKTAIGNLADASLEEILASDELAKIIKGFQRYRLEHPYCKKCLGSTSLGSWIIKPFASVAGLKLLKPFFYSQTRIYK
jgi:radical SAM protein with 4Fe4S-binding SPASM domain